MSGVLLAAALLVTQTGARAGGADTCFDAYEKAQRLRKDGHLRSAQDQLVVCAAKGCPAFVVKDCAEWSREVERMQPSVVFSAGDGRGHDLTNVSVFVDDARVASSLDGRAQRLDPGPHVVRFEWGGRTVKVDVVLAEGALRNVRGEFADPTALVPAGSAPQASRGVPVASWVLGGVALAAGGLFVAFALAGKSAEGCSPRCSDDEVRTIHRDNLVADIGWIGALALGASAVVVWAVQPGPAVSPRSGASLSVVPVPGGFGAALQF